MRCLEAIGFADRDLPSEAAAIGCLEDLVGQAALAILERLCLLPFELPALPRPAHTISSA